MKVFKMLWHKKLAKRNPQKVRFQKKEIAIIKLINL